MVPVSSNTRMTRRASTTKATRSSQRWCDFRLRNLGIHLSLSATQTAAVLHLSTLQANHNQGDPGRKHKSDTPAPNNHRLDASPDLFLLAGTAPVLSPIAASTVVAATVATAPVAAPAVGPSTVSAATAAAKSARSALLLLPGIVHIQSATV